MDDVVEMGGIFGNPKSESDCFFHFTLPETNIAPEKWMVGRLVSFWDGL